MSNMGKTVKFFLQHQFNKYYPVSIYKYSQPESLPRLTIYEPDLKSIKQIKNSENKVILTFHGMTMLGSKDPKFINACRSLAGCGFKVIAVQMDSMQKLIIESSIKDEVVKIIEGIAGNKELCPGGKVSIFAASFAGGICMMASSDERIAKKVNSICLVGSFADVESSIKYLLSSQGSDSYGRLIILKNFLKYSFDVPDEIYNSITIGLEDNFYKRDKPELPKYLGTLPVNQYDIMTRLLNDPYYRLYHWDRIRKNKHLEEMFDRFSWKNYLKKINASIVIIHGIYDNVIPALESIRLYNELQRLKVRSKLVLTPLLTHSEIKYSFNILPPAMNLLKGLSFYFSHI